MKRILLLQFEAKPTLPTCKLRLYLLQHVRDTVAKGIRYGESGFDMQVFTDADWAVDISRADLRRNTLYPIVTSLRREDL